MTCFRAYKTSFLKHTFHEVMPKMLPDYDPNDLEAGLNLLEDLTENASQIQQQVLEEILSANRHTEYLTSLLNGVSGKENFRKKVPVVSYEDIRPFIERIANGEPSDIISAQPITELLTSSGTSGGKPKMMPSTAEELDRKTFFYTLLLPLMNKYVDGLEQGKGMYLLFIKPEIRTPSGLMARPVLTSYYKSDNFRNRPFNPYTVYTSPDETIWCPDSKQSMYCQLLCGFAQRGEVLRVGAIFASAFLRGIKFLEENWKEMCLNIRTGCLSDWITDPGCRKTVSPILTRILSKSELADSVERECGKETWEGIIKKLWPKTKYIEVIVTGSMAQYIPTLEFYSGGLPLVSTMYASSECYFGINFTPLCRPSEVAYTLLPNMAYFEFLPVEEDEDDLLKVDDNCSDDASSQNLKTVELVDVKLGRSYEIVVTTFTGLYRYRVGDILKVISFYNKAPQFRFVHRRNVVLSIDTDKTNEEDLLKAVTNAKFLLEPFGILLTEYTSYADTSSIPGHYVLFWELKLKGCSNDKLCKLEPHLMQKCCFKVEESLDSVYRRCRAKDRSIGALEIRVVKQGTFDALMDFGVSQGSSVNQYKTPRCIKSEEALKILDSRVVGRFFSDKIPSWEPLN